MYSEKLMIVAVVVFVIALFMALRSLVLWYYKINVRVKNQEKIIGLLTELVNRRN